MCVALQEFSRALRVSRLGAIVWLLLAGAVLRAEGPDGRRAFDLAVDVAERSLKAFSEQAGCGVVFVTEVVRGVRTHAVKGMYTSQEALDLMLKDTVLSGRLDPATGAFAIRGTWSGKGKKKSHAGLGRRARREGGVSSGPTGEEGPGADNTSMNRNTPKILLAAALGAAVAAGQSVNPTPAVASTAASADDEVVELSPFDVNMSRDLGYLAENTLAGSRLNASLRDTAGSVSVFTKEFLDDLAITDVRELVQYSVNSEIDTLEGRAGAEQNPYVNAERLTPGLVIRGLRASLGLDYFTSLTPSDPYRVGRYEDSRGPNSILFGLGAPGGLLNQTSKVAATYRDQTSVRYGAGSWNRSRLEFDANRVLVRDKLALSIAALREDSGGWRDYDFRDKRRLFGSLKFRPLKRLTFTVMGETGRDKNAVIRSTVEADEALAWYDNRNALGVNAVTFTPTSVLPNAAMQTVGVVTRNGQRTGNTRRAIFIENDGTVFDASGTYMTGSYNNAAVRGPDGTQGVTASVLRINDPSFYPRHLNAAGPGMYRDQDINNYTVTIDLQATPNLAFNFGHNYQDTKAVVYLMTGTEPTLRGDPNRTLGLNGPANPWAGQLYFDGNWRRDTHEGHMRESRLSVSYQLNTKSKWLGRHRFAALYSETRQFDVRFNSWLALAGRPFNATPNNVNNRITVRNYLTEGNTDTYRVGDWRSLPPTVKFLGTDYSLVWASEVAGANNSGGEQASDSKLAVAQSYFLDNRLVTTLGWREESVDVIAYGYANDPLTGDVVNTDPSQGQLTRGRGRTRSLGAVYHLTDWLSLIANQSTNQGVPSLVRRVFPDGDLAPPSTGRGSDYGLGFNLLDGRLNAKVVYFTSNEKGRVDQQAFDGAAGRNTRVTDALAGVLTSTGGPLTAAQWAPLYQALNPPATSTLTEAESDGYEARLTANFTKHWRLVANYSYTDSSQTNMAGELAAWYGLKAVDTIRFQQGVSQDASGRWIVDPKAYEAGGTVAKWLELGALHPDANPSTLTTTNGLTVAQEIYNLVNNLNNNREEQLKRWGLRPHKISLFTAYDVSTGWAKGFTIGGGWRWRSPNIIGTNSKGEEITGKAITATDMMLGYTLRTSRLPGRLRFQVNISNVFDDTDIIPVRLSNSASAPDGYVLPGGRGIAYSRYDLVAPREIRFTTTYSF